MLKYLEIFPKLLINVSYHSLSCIEGFDKIASNLLTHGSPTLHCFIAQLFILYTNL